MGGYLPECPKHGPIVERTCRECAEARIQELEAQLEIARKAIQKIQDDAVNTALSLTKIGMDQANVTDRIKLVAFLNRTGKSSEDAITGLESDMSPDCELEKTRGQLEILEESMKNMVLTWDEVNNLPAKQFWNRISDGVLAIRMALATIDKKPEEQEQGEGGE